MKSVKCAKMKYACWQLIREKTEAFFVQVFMQYCAVEYLTLAYKCCFRSETDNVLLSQTKPNVVRHIGLRK